MQHNGVVRSILNNCVDIGKQLHQLSDYESTLEISGDIRQMRSNWVLKESIKRSYCLLYGIELLSGIPAVTAESRRSECRHGYTRVPLPSSRDLWSSASNQEWARQYKQFCGTKSQENVLRIQDLVSSLQSSVVDDGTALSLDAHKDISEWCERLDEFGMLVWMATMLEQGL
uniref:Uncharacterized protein n=2 Tax=Talaromyces marneffei TaxID=37727 RepID=A0A093XAA8_TALMA